MKCIYCGCDTQVNNSRLQKKQNSIWRRRECIDCQAIFTTNESIDLSKVVLVINGKRSQPFLRDKLFVSILDSLKHRKTALSDARGLTDTVITRIYPLIQLGVIQKRDIAAKTHLILKRFDHVAATHYSAFHPVTDK